MNDPQTNALTIEQAAELQPEQIAEVPVDQLASLRSLIGEWIDHLKAVQANVSQGLEIKYAQTEKTLRDAKGQETGRVTFVDGEYQVTVDQPKTVEWDQAGLEQVARVLQEDGQDPSQFIQHKLALPEKKFEQLPPRALQAAQTARTVKHGAKKVTVTPAKG